jgi:CheY-like chemotaxis protein
VPTTQLTESLQIWGRGLSPRSRNQEKTQNETVLDTQKVLVLDDDRDSGQHVCDVAEGLGIECFSTTDPMTFLESVTESTTLIFLDLVLPYSGGIELLEKLGQMHCSARIVLMSGADPRVLETMDGWGRPSASTVSVIFISHFAFKN